MARCVLLEGFRWNVERSIEKVEQSGSNVEQNPTKVERLVANVETAGILELCR